MKKMTKKRFSRWFWDEGMDLLPFIVIMIVYIVWIVYGITK